MGGCGIVSIGRKALFVGILTAGMGVAGVSASGQEGYRLVDMRIGTAHEGQTVPFVSPPFAMTNWTPQTQATEKKCIAPYYDKDTTISGIRGSHWMSGSCVQDYGSVTLMPVTGPVGDLTAEGRESKFSHADEVMEPAYYSVKLARYGGTRAEVTGTLRAGILRFTYPAGEQGTVVIEPNVKLHEGFIEIRTDGTIAGYNPVRRIYQGAGQLAGFSGYFVVKFERKAVASGTWCGAKTVAGSVKQEGGCPRMGAYVTFAASKQPLVVKVGTSMTSLAEAEKNLNAELPGWDFAGTRAATEAAWKAVLGKISIEGGTLDQRKTFYTALYHATLAPRLVSDVDGTYNGFANEGKLHHIDGSYYDDFSLWDTFRAVHPLMTILDPRREEEMVQSLVLKGQQGGFLSIFPAWNSYTSEMVGDHDSAVMADAMAKGLTHFDMQEAYRLVRQNAMVTPPYADYKEGKGRRALDSYIKYGYVPLEDPVADAFHKAEQVSRTLEYAYDDSQVAIMADHLGKADDAAFFRKRSESWRNVLDPETGFARGRHQDGSWATPFDPAVAYPYITEGIPWQYTFFVPQNVPGLIDAVGGREKFVAKLDGLFDRKLYDQGNEPSHAIAFLYDAAGAPWKTQQRIRAVMAEYNSSVDGLPGNDDDGQMSAWYVLSAMGFYPVCPGVPEYWIGSPIFDRVTLHLTGGKEFSVVAKHQSEANRYIQSSRLNGHPLGGFKLRHEDLVRGGELVFEMGPEPAR
jgi:predicted alpha-1,2-mannosidase